MKKFINLIFTIAFLSFFSLACNSRKFDQLSPESQNYLRDQESSRCECLNKYAGFEKTLSKTIDYIEKLPNAYDLDNLSQTEFYQINLNIVEAIQHIKLLTECVNTKAKSVDNFVFFQIQYEISTIMEIDSTVDERERLHMMNVPAQELIEEICPEHINTMNLFYEFIEVSKILPKGLN